MMQLCESFQDNSPRMHCKSREGDVTSVIQYGRALGGSQNIEAVSATVPGITPQQIELTSNRADEWLIEFTQTVIQFR